jgi:hypothetical protein
MMSMSSDDLYMLVWLTEFPPHDKVIEEAGQRDGIVAAMIRKNPDITVLQILQQVQPMLNGIIARSVQI